MNTLNIAATRTTPSISYSPEHAWFRVVGISIPENAREFYAPVITWLTNHSDGLPNGIAFEFSLPYFNSSSIKSIYSLLKLIKKMRTSGKVLTITWYVEDDDDMSTDTGEAYKELLGLDIAIANGHLDV